MKSKTLALSAISAGFIAIALAIGANFEFVDLFALVVASVFVLLPLHLNSYKGAILTFLAGGILGALFGFLNFFTVVFPAYFGFFGVYPIVKFFMQKKGVKRYVINIIGLIWCVGAVFGIYYFYVLVMNIPFSGMPNWVAKYIEIVVALVGILFYFVFDRYLDVMRIITDKYLKKIIK